MGMYTELNLAVALKPDLPESVENILNMMKTPDEYIEPSDLPDHLFFKTGRWYWFLHASGSYYFPYPNRAYTDFYFDQIAKQWYFNCRVNFKNYSREIQLFLDWLAPYVESRGCVGHMFYETWALPRLIILDNDGAHFVDITQMVKVKETDEDNRDYINETTNYHNLFEESPKSWIPQKMIVELTLDESASSYKIDKISTETK